MKDSGKSLEFLRDLKSLCIEIVPTDLPNVLRTPERALSLVRSGRANSPLVYDFSGFDRKFYEMTSNSPDASEIELGKRLQPLRDEGVLIIGSGFMTHGSSQSIGTAPKTLIDGYFMGLSKRSILVA